MDKDIKTLQHFFNDKNLHIYRDDDNNIIIDGDILIYDRFFDKIPVKIHKVNGNISWHGDIDSFHKGSLSTLENFPDIVNGSVFIYKNPYLKSLKGCPKHISGTLQCDRCNISDISDISEYIGQYLILSYNPIKDISILENIYIGKNVELIETNADISNIKLKNDSSVIIKEKPIFTIF